MTNFPSGFAGGLTVRGLPLLQTNPGQIFWVANGTPTAGADVRSTAGSDSSRGTFQRPFNSINGALAQCQANQGDIIIVKPGHAETISTAAIVNLSVAGVAIVGLGSGSNRPTFTFTAAAGNIPITAANMSLSNMRFVANFADVVSMFTATGTATPTDLSIDSCEFKDTSNVLNALTVVTGNATAQSMAGLAFTRNRVSSLGTTAATTMIKLSSATDRLQIRDNWYVGAILNDTAALLAAGANAMTNFDFGRNVAYRPNTSSTNGSFISGSGVWTGHAYDNYLYQLDATSGIWIPTGLGIGFSNNFSPITGGADKSALINPAAG